MPFAVLAVLLVADATSSTQAGVLHIPPITSRVYCTQQPFPEAFSTAPRIVVTPTHRRFDQDWTHHAISAWSEHANEFEFRVCLRKMDIDQAHKQATDSKAEVDSAISVEWFAWTGDTIDSAEATGFVTPPLRKGTSCFTRKFGQHFDSPPLVVGSVDHSNIYNSLGQRALTHHAIASWVEGISSTQFEVCFSESTHTNVGGHRPLTFNYVAFDKSHTTALSDAHGRSAALAGGDERFDGTRCIVVEYGATFHVPPFVIATVNHHGSAGGHDPLVTWTEEVGTGSFRFCGREMEFTDGSHDGGAHVDWVAISMDSHAATHDPTADEVASLSVTSTGGGEDDSEDEGDRSFRCDFTVNFVHPKSPWASPFAYTEVALTPRIGSRPVYGARSSNSEAVAYCKRQCVHMHGQQACTGFFFQQRRTGEEVCGFYSADLASGNWVAHGHQAGAICQRASNADAPATTATPTSASSSSMRHLRGRGWG